MSSTKTLLGDGNTIVGGAQKFGILAKKPIGHQSTKWSKRFFVIKDGFLFYYPESEKKIFEETKMFNVHPKGAIPLGNCSVEEVPVRGINHGLNIRLPDHKTSVCLSAETEEMKGAWKQALEKASKITLENCQMGEAIIQSLHKQSLDLEREKQEYAKKYSREAEELGIEREQKKALEEFNAQLAEEKERIEKEVNNLLAFQDEIKWELNESLNAGKKLEVEREHLLRDTADLQKHIDELSAERSSVINLLGEQKCDVDSVEDNQFITNLTKKLEKLSFQAKEYEQSKAEIKDRMVKNELLTARVESEKLELKEEASRLRQNIEKMTNEKDWFQQRLEEEVRSRMEMENELRICKEALSRLEAMTLFDSRESHNSLQIKADVSSLKNFFERCASESKLEIEHFGYNKMHRISRRITFMRHTHSRSSPTKAWK